jgi:hypothetical protein
VLRLRRRRRSPAPKAEQRVTREQARSRKAWSSALREREEQLLHLLFLWRCFGDGIAFIYQSKYSLKHTYYDGNYNVKAPAGFMTEHGRLKRGFAREYRILCSGIKHNVPVVLCDLTNVIRYGDVCALGAEDPVCIEVKTSRNRNARTERQIRLLQEFTLSMEPMNCVAFMQQAFGLMVFIELKEVKAAFARRGVTATMLMDGTYSVQITKTPDNLIKGAWRVSEQMLGRVATEFLSIEWFADEMSRTFDVEQGPPMTLDDALALSGRGHRGATRMGRCRGLLGTEMNYSI